MGRRGDAETLAALFVAFSRRGTWSQSELAEAVGVGTRAVRARLIELEHAGVPFERSVDHPHVYWSVRKGWFPGGLLITAKDALELLRQLVRAPKSRGRDALVRRLVEALPGRRESIDPTAGVIGPLASDCEDAFLGTVEDAATRRVTLRFHYFSASRGVLEWRLASVQRVDASHPARFIAMCHRAGKLKWFRVDNMTEAKLDEREAFRSCDSATVDTLLATSLDGFHQGDRPVRCAFFVRHPESRWVERNLPAVMLVVPVDAGVRVQLETNGLLRLARFVVGLGGAARAETEELRAAVLTLAREAMAANGEGKLPD